MGILREIRVLYLGEAGNLANTELTTPNKPGPISQKPQERGFPEESTCGANVLEISLWLSTWT